MAKIRQSVLDIWNDGDIDELDREDLIDLAVYFEDPDECTLIDDIEPVDEDEKEDEEEPDEPAAVPEPIEAHGPMKITVTNVLIDGDRKVKMTFENVKSRWQTPAEYTRKGPFCYMDLEKFKYSRGLFDTTYVSQGTIRTQDEADTLIEHVRECAAHLANVNARIDADKREWEGKETVYII